MSLVNDPTPLLSLLRDGIFSGLSGVSVPENELHQPNKVELWWQIVVIVANCFSFFIAMIANGI